MPLPVDRDECEGMSGTEVIRSAPFGALTGLRAVAAYLVFFHHYPPVEVNIHPFFRCMAEQGYVGVSIFFVLSGFLLHYRYAAVATLRWDFLKRYMRNRLSRIYPLYGTLCALSLLMSRDRSLFSWMVNLSLAKGFSDEWKFSHVAQAWSITVEECFYISFPVIVVLMLKKKWPALSILALIYAMGYAFMQLGAAHPWRGFFANFHFMSIYTFWGRAAEFFVGMTVARWAPKLRGIVPSSFALTLLGFCFTTVAFVSLCLVASPSHIAVQETGGLILHNWILPVGIGFLILGLAYEDTILSRCLGSTTCVLLGKSSYAFYLLQQGVLLGIINTASPIIMMLQIILVSVVVFLFFEDPINRFLRGERGIFVELSRFYIAISQNASRVRKGAGTPRTE